VSSWSFRRTPFLIAGPCVVEDSDTMARVSRAVAEAGARFDMPVCFKASFDKANRARAGSARGPGLDAGLEALARVKRETGLPILTDIHEPDQAAPSAEVADVLQIPAFLCRQTDLLLAAGATGKPVNVKKGQWMQAEGMAGAVEKVRAGGATEVAVTERGTFFGYGDLVVDFRNFARLREATGAPVIFDATHSVQQPGQASGGASGGLRQHIPDLMAAAAVAGADGFFLETHPDPSRALSDAATQWPLDRLSWLLERTLDLWHRARESANVGR
jgi:2-dehydro-3-deoxyphosphooctonate aldolase (KDO 8-P synthase)